MKKLLACLLCLLLGVSLLTACQPKMAEIALVMAEGTIDDGTINQEAWAGIAKYCEEKGISNQSFQASENTQTARMDAVSLAVKRGAMLVVCSGASFQDTLVQAAKEFPDVTFSEVQAGFLAGYAAVENGWTKLGFFSEKKDSQSILYGYGFVQGAQAYAKAKEMPAQSVEIRYAYADKPGNIPENQAIAKEWFQNGAEAIFTIGYELTNGVIAAAEEFGKQVIGADVNWSDASQNVAISAVKHYSQAVQDLIDLSYNEELTGGSTVQRTAAENGIALTMDDSHLKNFTRKAYDNLVIALADDVSGMAADLVNTPAEDGSIGASGIVLSEVKVIE